MIVDRQTDTDTHAAQNILPMDLGGDRSKTQV